MNRNRRKTVFLILSILWMVVMWGFSAENDVQSSGRSLGIAKSICSTFVKNYEGLSTEKQEDIAGKLTFPIRKSAHALEYGILGLLVAGWNVDYKSRMAKSKEKPTSNQDGENCPGIVMMRTERNRLLRRQLMISFLITVTYAAVDEVHQLFVPGRAGMVRDVLIDGLGAFAGLLILYLVIRKHSEKCDSEASITTES